MNVLELLGAGRLAGVPLSFRPDLLRDTRMLVFLSPPGSMACLSPPPVLVAWSPQVLNLMLAGVLWHDEPEHCRTWTGGACRCDVEPL